MRRLRIIRNPRAAGGRRAGLFTDVLQRLEQAGLLCDVQETQAANDAARLVRETDANEVDLLVIAGGDGTFNDALQGFEPGAPPVAILPMGTANVLSHELGLSQDPDALTQYILTGVPKKIFAGRVNDRRFLTMASLGIDATTIATLSRSAKVRYGKFAYLIQGTKIFFTKGFPPFEVLLDGQRRRVSGIIASRGPRYGGNFVLAPGADMSSDSMVATVFPPAGRLATLLRLAAIPLGLTRREGWLPQQRCHTLHIEAPLGAPIQGDGDIIGQVPATVHVDDTMIRLLVPKG